MCMKNIFKERKKKWKPWEIMFRPVQTSLTVTGPVRGDIDICLLNEVDHPSVGVGHLPVWGQWFQILIPHHVISKVHGAVCLVVTWDGLHPIRWLGRPLSVFYSKQKSMRSGEIYTLLKQPSSFLIKCQVLQISCCVPHSVVVFENHK